ncbi:MAG: hypothetical protein FJZ94_02730 [Chloroflexi bacterium]|nr:hypothetical protein [Chloroflexota bacterium]
MNRGKQKLLFLVIILLTSPGHILGCDSRPSGTKDISVVPPVSKPAEFQVGPLAISPAVPMDGDTIKVSAGVNNIGDAEGAYAAVLAIDGKEADRKSIVVAPASSSTVDFQVADVASGIHEISMGTSRVNVTVYERTPYTIKYCRGQADWTIFSADLAAFRSSGDLGHIVHFSPPVIPFEIRAIKICGEARTEIPSELDTRQVIVRLWNKDRSRQLWSGNFPWRLFENEMAWREITVPDMRVEDDFYVEVITHSDLGYQAKNYLDIAFELARDALPLPRRLEYYRLSAAEPHSGWSQNGQPFERPGRKISINWCISVDGEGPQSPRP